MSVARSPTTMSTGRPRRVEPELLDDLPADDPRAVRSRADLQRINRLMGSASILLRTLDPIVDRVAAATTLPPHLLELGAGDGSLMLRMARRRNTRWANVRLTLLDRQPVVSDATLAEFRDLGWQVDVAQVDVFDWLAQPPAARNSDADNPIVIANLFVHHFAGLRLEHLMQAIAQRAQAFVCLEPRRSTVALVGSHLLGAIGCNAITRHDAVLSVHAGFRDRELSALWPQSGNDWRMRECPAALFSQLFTAIRAR